MFSESLRVAVEIAIVLTLRKRLQHKHIIHFRNTLDNLRQREKEKLRVP